jgi:hypothetical protein
LRAGVLDLRCLDRVKATDQALSLEGDGHGNRLVKLRQ